MKKLLLALALMFTLTMSAKQDAEVAGASFGASFTETLTALKGNLGDPNNQASDKLVYLNKNFEGMKADRMEFGFQTLNGSNVLNQARVYFYCANKAAAVAKMKLMAKKLGQKYPVSYDEEDGGTAFYKGGQSPLGIGSLFTIFVSPYQGKWTCQVRYGKFTFK